MTLQKAFDDLCRELDNTRRALRGLAEAAAGMEEAGAAAGRLMVMADDATMAAGRGQRAARRPTDIDSIRRVLPKCQRRLSEMAREFRAEFGCAEAPGELAYATRRLAAPLFAAQFALSVCWQCAAAYAVVNPGGMLPYFPRSENG